MLIVANNLSKRDQKRLVTSADAAFEESAERKVRAFANLPDLRVLGLTGPTCAGKTMAARKLISILEENGRRVNVISIDDFFLNVDIFHRLSDPDPSVKLDYDSEETLDIPLLAETVEDLLLSKPTRIPKFDFKTGQREASARLLYPSDEDVFLFEGIQVLYPKVDAILSRGNCKSIYIAPLSPISTGGEVFSPNEIRLMRRIVRDFRHRSAKPEFTMYLWQTVRENEEKAIFPFRDRCEVEIDSTLPYDVGMLKPYLQPLLEGYRTDAPHAEEAAALLRKLKNVQSISSDYLGKNSLYKEFI